MGVVPSAQSVSHTRGNIPVSLLVDNCSPVLYSRFTVGRYPAPAPIPVSLLVDAACPFPVSLLVDVAHTVNTRFTGRHTPGPWLPDPS